MADYEKSDWRIRKVESGSKARPMRAKKAGTRLSARFYICCLFKRPSNQA